MSPTTTLEAGAGRRTGQAYERVSTRFGLAFTLCQITVMVGMAVLVLPHGGAPGDPAAERGRSILDAAASYQVGNYALMLSGMLMLGFLGAVQARLRRLDASGVLATVAIAAGTLLALVWPLAGLFHDVVLEVARVGTDVRLLSGWDAIAPYSLAFSVFPRIFFVGAILLALRAAEQARALRHTGVVVLGLSLVGSATLVAHAAFPLLAVSTLSYELWVGALAWHWLHDHS